MSQTYLFLLGWTLFVTNAPQSKISLQHIYDFYIVLVHFLLAPLRIPDQVWAEREVSQVRFHQILTRFARSFKQGLTDRLMLANTLDEFVRHVQRFALKQKRRQQPNAYAQLAQLAWSLP